MAWPSDLVRTKNWGSEVLTDSDLEGQFDLIINWLMAALNSSTGHTHSGSGNNGPLLSSSAVTTTFGNGFTTVTAASGDYVLLATDVSDSNKTKKALVSDIVTLAAPVAATQAEMESGSSTTVMVTPGRAHFHPSAAKFWASFSCGAGTPSLDASYNVTSISDRGSGLFTANFTTALSSANYSWGGGAYDSSTTTACGIGVTSTESAPSTTAFQFVVMYWTGGTVNNTPEQVTVHGYGDI